MANDRDPRDSGVAGSRRRGGRARSALLLIILIALSFLVRLPHAVAQAPAQPRLNAVEQGNSVRLQWRIETEQRGLSQVDGSLQPTRDASGALLPSQLLALSAPHGAAVKLQIERLTAIPWNGVIKQKAPPPSADRQLLTTNTADTSSLPSAPVTVLRDGTFRGTRIVVVAFYPIFQGSDHVEAATTLDVTIPGVTVLDLNAAEDLVTTGPRPVALAPANPLAATAAIKIRVAQKGMQRVSGAALAAAGLNTASVDPSHLQLWHGPTPVALQELGTADGRLDAEDELRFYAGVVGDRWNASDTYWLTVEAQPGLRMSVRSAMPGTAPARASAVELSVWRNNKVYDSQLAGPDGDHWFSASLQTGPGQPAATLHAALNTELPLTPGNAVVAVSGSVYMGDQHHLSVGLGASTADVEWSGTDNWTQTATLADNASDLRLSLVPGKQHDGLQIDEIAVQRPVALDFGGQGATFSGVAGRWRYRIAHTAIDRILYDVTNTAEPTVLTLPPGTTTEFEDGPTPRQYVLSGPGAIATPSLTPYTANHLDAPLNVDVLYIAPAAFHRSLAPLVAQREAQGYRVRIVDVQAIYDTWSYGQVAPEAIRRFLQFAVSTWQRPPSNVVLVGDGTSDPLNYTQRNNINFVPPYLAMVDPWIGETACETCFGQLDGADPLDDPLPDLAVGRFPVKSPAELDTLVTKLLAYETGPTDLAWQTRNLYVADNPDEASDFDALADRSATLQPSGVDVQRLYYDPASSGSGVPWREPNALTARQRTLAALNTGAGIVNYIGHAYYWQWALTDPTVTPSYLLGLYDADTLTNQGKLPIVLELTCYTSAFQTPAYSGTTLDERLLLHDRGGAAAVWGSTGLSGMGAHDALQRGFYRALWAKAQPPSLGELTTAGYLELFVNGSCCQDALRTHALLGDPSTKPRIVAAQRSYLPLLHR